MAGTARRVWRQQNGGKRMERRVEAGFVRGKPPPPRPSEWPNGNWQAERPSRGAATGPTVPSKAQLTFLYLPAQIMKLSNLGLDSRKRSLA